MSSLFRITKKYKDTEDQKKMIVVIPPAFLILMAGIAIVVIAVIFRTFTGWNTTVISMEGIYHPGVSNSGELICFPQATNGKAIEKGMRVNIYPSEYDQSKFGNMEGTVTYVDDYVSSWQDVKTLLEEDSLTNTFMAQAPVMTVICELDKDDTSKNGYSWTKEEGKSLAVNDGTFVHCTVIISYEQPFIDDMY